MTSAVSATPTKIIALLAFTRDDAGELHPAIEPRECQSAADLINGEFGEPVEIYRWGDIPEME